MLGHSVSSTVQGVFSAWWRSDNIISHSSLIRIKHPSGCLLAEEKWIIFSVLYKKFSSYWTRQLNPYWCDICILFKCLFFHWAHVGLRDKACFPAWCKAFNCFNIVVDGFFCMNSRCPFFLHKLPLFVCRLLFDSILWFKFSKLLALNASPVCFLPHHFLILVCLCI